MPIISKVVDHYNNRKPRSGRDMNDTTDIQSSIIAPKRRSPLADFFIRLVRDKPLGTISGIIILILIFVAIFANALAPYPYCRKCTWQTGCTGPSVQYLLGTDQLGRDFLSRIDHRGSPFDICGSVRVTAVNVMVAVPDRRHFRIHWWQI